MFHQLENEHLSVERHRIILVDIRRTVAAVLLTLLPLAYSMPAMCDQCQFGAAGPSSAAGQNKSVAFQQASPKVTTGEHCQHMATSRSGAASQLVSASQCQNNPCKQALDPVAKLSRSYFAQPSTSVRFIVIAEISGHHRHPSKGTIRSFGERPRFNPSVLDPLSTSLRI